MNASRREARAIGRLTETATRPPTSAARPAQRSLWQADAVSEQIALAATLWSLGAPWSPEGRKQAGRPGRQHSRGPDTPPAASPARSRFAAGVPSHFARRWAPAQTNS